jgi:hypothetical protein
MAIYVCLCSDHCRHIVNLYAKGIPLCSCYTAVFRNLLINSNIKLIKQFNIILG